MSYTDWELSDDYDPDEPTRSAPVTVVLGADPVRRAPGNICAFCHCFVLVDDTETHLEWHADLLAEFEAMGSLIAALEARIDEIAGTPGEPGPAGPTGPPGPAVWSMVGRTTTAVDGHSHDVVFTFPEPLR